MKVQRTFDAELVWAIMTTPAIWATIASDDKSPVEYVPDVDEACYLTVYNGRNELVALYIVRRLNEVMAEIHVQVLPQHRKEYSIPASKAVLEWLWEKAPWCRKLIAWVPALYPNVRKHAETLGFKLEGTNTQSCLKDGEIHDQWLLGLTRPTEDEDDG